MASNCRHFPVDRSLGWVAFIVEKSQEAPSVKRHRRGTVYRLGKEKRRELRQERHLLRR